MDGLLADPADNAGATGAAGAAEEGEARGPLAELKADPGPASLETLLREVTKLGRVRAVGLPAGLFAGASEKLVEAWRARAARSYPSDLRAAPEPVRLTLLAALCWVRQAEITDALVDLLIALVHKVNVRAERRVEGELREDLRRVRNKQGLLYAPAEAAVTHPEETVRVALYPVVAESTLRDLVREAKATDEVFRARVRTVLSASYSGHYRRMLPQLLEALDFRCNNTTYQPVTEALELLRSYAGRGGRVKHYDPAERVPLDGVVPAAWRDAVAGDTGRADAGRADGGRAERVPYELSVLATLRDALRRATMPEVAGQAPASRSPVKHHQLPGPACPTWGSPTGTPCYSSTSVVGGAPGSTSCSTSARGEFVGSDRDGQTCVSAVRAAAAGPFPTTATTIPGRDGVAVAPTTVPLHPRPEAACMAEARARAHSQFPSHGRLSSQSRDSSQVGKLLTSGARSLVEEKSAS